MAEVSKIIKSVCGKIVANIKRHLGTHSEDHFKCNTCDKLFSTGRNLSDHKSDVHNQIKEKYHCKECNVSARLEKISLIFL